MPFTVSVIVGWQGRQSDQREEAPCMTSKQEEGITGADVPKHLNARWDGGGICRIGFLGCPLSSSLQTSLHLSRTPSHPLLTCLPSARLPSVSSCGLIARHAARETQRRSAPSQKARRHVRRSFCRTVVRNVGMRERQRAV